MYVNSYLKLCYEQMDSSSMSLLVTNGFETAIRSKKEPINIPPVYYLTFTISGGRCVAISSFQIVAGF